LKIDKAQKNTFKVRNTIKHQNIQNLINIIKNYNETNPITKPVINLAATQSKQSYQIEILKAINTT